MLYLERVQGHRILILQQLGNGGKHVLPQQRVYHRGGYALALGL